MKLRLSRRRVLQLSAASLSFAMPAISRAQSRPTLSHGLQSGDVDQSSGIIWARADRPSRVMVEYATTDQFANPVRVPFASALPDTDFTVKHQLQGLPADQEIFYRVTLADLSDINMMSEPVIGHFRTAPSSRRSVTFGWSGDSAGQGWGINFDDGGMKTYAAMGNHDMDFFIHSGDTIYADGPMKAEVDLPNNGGKWKNLIVEGVDHVAETLDDYRGRYKYNLLDKNFQAFNAKVPTFYQWDDHEVMNNWSASKDISKDDRYKTKSVALLAANASHAFHEMTPTRRFESEPGRVYRRISYGPLVDVFMLDMRSYRGPNGDNLQTTLTPESGFLGAEQVRWLKRELSNSKATWKVIAADMPLSLVVWDDFAAKKGFEAIANNDPGAPLGRELEIADLLRFIKASGVKNTVWLTADVHYTAAHYYDPSKAKFQDFEPFWEFVSGPIHAGTFGPNDLDATFGPELKFYAGPEKDEGQNLPPSKNKQYFGLISIDGKSEQMTVRLMDRLDKELYKVVLDPSAQS